MAKNKNEADPSLTLVDAYRQGYNMSEEDARLVADEVMSQMAQALRAGADIGVVRDNKDGTFDLIRLDIVKRPSSPSPRRRT